MLVLGFVLSLEKGFEHGCEGFAFGRWRMV